MSFVVSGPLRLATRTWEGSRPGLVAVHATGFCKELWYPVVDELRALGQQQRVVALDQRGHGDSDEPPLPCDWWDLGRDVVTTVGRAGDGPLVGVGHSSGAAALVMAELLRPGTISGLVLVEPIIFPPPFGRVADHWMTQVALRRRYAFASQDDARDNFAGKGVFSTWQSGAIDLYVQHGMRAEDGRWVLKCRPEVEAEFYRGAGAHGAWARLPEVACPVTIIAGEHSTTHTEPYLSALVNRFREATVTVVPGASHFVPMETPEVVARSIAATVLR